MKIIWCKDLDDVINIARAHGWLFYYNYQGKNYYYVYAGTESELLCLVVGAEARLDGKYVTIDDDGKVVTSEKPLMPACARIISVAKDAGFEELLKQL